MNVMVFLCFRVLLALGFYTFFPVSPVFLLCLPYSIPMMKGFKDSNGLKIPMNWKQSRKMEVRR